MGAYGKLDYMQVKEKLFQLNITLNLFSRPQALPQTSLIPLRFRTTDLGSLINFYNLNSKLRISIHIG
jgi:hypothetical protein